MKTNVALKYQPFKGPLAGFAQVTCLDQYRQDRIEKTLNGVVYVNRYANVLVRDLFCPKWRSGVVVIKLRDGSYLNPCDFGSSHGRRRRRTNKKHL